MAEEVEMKPVDASEPPKVNPFAAQTEKKVAPVNPAPSALRPGLKLPPKPGATIALKPGLRLPSQAGLKPGLKLPTKPGVTAALKPGLRLPPKPVIRKPGATGAAQPLPKPVAVDAQGVGKLPTVNAPAVSRETTPSPVVSEAPKPLEALKSVTQKLKGITQEIPQQAILHKTGIIADSAMTEAQKEAAKHKTSRISLSDAMGVAPVKNESAPMKTIRIKRPVNIPGAAKPAVPEEASAQTPAAPAAETAAPAATPTITQRKTLKISRPGGAMRPSGKFGVRRPSAATTVAAQPPSSGTVAAPVATDAAVADIPDLPTAPVPVAKPVSEGPAWLWTLSTLVQVAACVVIAGLAWLLYQNTQTSYF